MAIENGIFAALEGIVDTALQDGLVIFEDLMVSGDHWGFAAQPRAMDASYMATRHWIEFRHFVDRSLYSGRNCRAGLRLEACAFKGANVDCSGGIGVDHVVITMIICSVTFD